MLKRYFKFILLLLLFFVPKNIFGLMADTIVLTSDCSDYPDIKKVKDLEKGDGLLIYNFYENRIEVDASLVKKIKKKRTKKLVRIDTNVGFLKVGLEQKIYNREVLRFVEAKDLKIGDRLYSPGLDEFYVTDVYIYEIPEPVDIYDISIDGANIFFILNSRGDPILVHNFAATATMSVCLYALVEAPIIVEALKVGAVVGAVVITELIFPGSTGIVKELEDIIKQTPFSSGFRKARRGRKRERIRKREEADNKIKDVLKDATPGNKTKGKTTQKEKNGGWDQAQKDFDKLGVTDVHTIPNGKAGKLPDGRKVDVRTKSNDERVTLEIIKKNGRRLKIRYND